MDSDWGPVGTLTPRSEVTFDAVLDGSVRLVEIGREGMTCQLTVRRQSRPARGALSLRERSVVRRLALGHCQKLVAYDFGLAHTTVSSHLRGALDKLGLARWEHAVLVAAVLEAHGAGGAPAPLEAPAGQGPGEPEGQLVVRRELGRARLSALTEAERQVALLVVDGCANSEVGRRRRCSSRTVANQISSVFRKLGVHGRCELIRHLVLVPLEGEGTLEAADIAPQSDRRATGTADDPMDVKIPPAALPARTG